MHYFASEFLGVLAFPNKILMIQAYQSMGQGDLPKFTVIIAQKNHHTKLFQADSPENVPPGKKPCPA